MAARLNVDDLYGVLESWNQNLRKEILLIACGGTALTLYGHKASTKDVDFVVPDLDHYELLKTTLVEMGYIDGVTGYGLRHPDEEWIIELSYGQSIFNLTELLDPLQERHRVIRNYQNIVLGGLQPDDLIISKMFRGDLVDRDDSLLLIKSESLDLLELTERYIDTAGYDTNPAKCKTHLGFLIKDLEDNDFDVEALKEVYEKWQP